MYRYVCWALLVYLAFSNVVTSYELEGLLLKTVKKSLSAESVIEKLSNPKYRSGAADCDLDVQTFLNAVSQKELWALKVFDSSSYFITGVLNGNTGALGNYDECLYGATPGNHHKYFSLYSRVEILLQQKQNTTQKSSRNAFARVLPTVNESYQSDFEWKGNATIQETEQWLTVVSLNLGICWMRSCGAVAPGRVVEDILRMSDGPLQSSGYRLRVSPPLPGADDIGLPPQLGRADWAVIIICIVIASLAIIGTFLDISMLRNPASRKNPGWKTGFLVFSVYTNGQRLISVGRPSPDSLSAVGGLRVFSILWVMLGHRYRYTLYVPYANKLDFLNEAKNWGKQLILGAPLSVDTFFTIGGILNCYVFCSTMRKGRGFSIIQFFLHRYIRLTPAFAMMIGLHGTIIYYFSEGPFWLKIAGDDRNDCRNYWWTGLLYVSNFVNPDNQCVFPSWYLAVDMQLHWFSILILLPLWRWRKVGIAWLMSLIAVSCAIPFAIVYIKGYRTPLPTESLTHPGLIDDSMTYIYYPPHARATSYFVGLLIGYYLYQVRFVVRGFRLTKNIVIAGWVLSTIMALVSIFTAYPLYQFEKDVSIWYSAFYIALYRLPWSLSIAWIVFACGTGYGGPVNSLLSWSPFVVLGRLVYGMYLTHAAIQMVTGASIRSPEYYNDFIMMQRSLADFVLSAIFGAILCLGLDSPISALEKVLLHPPQRETKESSTVRSDRSNPQEGIDNPGLDVVVSEELRHRPISTADIKTE